MISALNLRSQGIFHGHVWLSESGPPISGSRSFSSISISVGTILFETLSCKCTLHMYAAKVYLYTVLTYLYIYMYISNIHRTLETVQMISHTHWWPCSRWRVLPHGVAKIGGHDVPSDAKSRRGTLQSRALLGHWLHFWSETCIGCWYFCRFNGV